jgi:ribonuclease HI
LVVFTDGSCSRNGKSNAHAGIGIHFPDGELNDVSKIFDISPITNQRAELFAILTTLRYINSKLSLKNYKVIIKTDSEYSRNCVTKWVSNWIKNGWKTQNNTPVSNKDFIELIYKYVQKYDIEIEHVKAHTDKSDDDSNGNRIADELATKATNKALEKNKLNEKKYSNSGSKTTKKKNNDDINWNSSNVVIELIKNPSKSTNK